MLSKISKTLKKPLNIFYISITLIFLSFLDYRITNYFLVFKSEYKFAIGLSVLIGLIIIGIYVYKWKIKGKKEANTWLEEGPYL